MRERERKKERERRERDDDEKYLLEFAVRDLKPLLTSYNQTIIVYRQAPVVAKSVEKIRHNSIMSPAQAE